MGEPLRILRVVIVSALILLGVKTVDLMSGHNARAEGNGQAPAAPQSASAVKIATPEAKPDGAKPDAEKPDAGKPAATPAPQAPRDMTDMTRSEVEVLQNLSARRQELDERGREIDMREKLLKASEQRVDERIAELKSIEANVQSLLQQRDAAQEAQLLGLVKVYEGMKPADAARIFDKLDMDIMLPVAQRMKPAKISPVLAAMDEDAAKRLTVGLARHLNGGKAQDNALPAPETVPAAPPAQGG